MYINSPGGVVTSGLAIYDTMQFVRPAVSTLCVGQAASMGSLLLAAGQKDLRFALPNSRIMLHQPSGGQGQADIMLHAQEILNLQASERNLRQAHRPAAQEDRGRSSATTSSPNGHGMGDCRQGHQQATGGSAALKVVWAQSRYSPGSPSLGFRRDEASRFAGKPSKKSRISLNFHH